MSPPFAVECRAERAVLQVAAIGGVLRAVVGPQSRLFQRHIGATPLQVARTLRVQRAKRLLDQTKLSMSDVAARAGFASLRRFNAVFAEVYKRTPSEVRRLRFKPV
jgi:transcriptional regulator GlxA family with amidase domain